MSYSKLRKTRKASALLLSTMLASGVTAPAIAQIAPPPVRSAVDENGVDVINGTFNVAQTDLTIGADLQQGIVYQRINNGNGWWNSLVGTINQSGIKFTVTLGGQSDSFLQSGSVYNSTEANGATLTKVGSVYTYTGRNGLVATFQAQSDKFQAYSANAGRITSIVHPDGAKLTFTYQTVSYCEGGVEEGTCPGGIVKVARLSSVNHSNGYQVKFKHVSDFFSDTDVGAWLTVQSASAINNAVEYCAPTANSCSLVNNWPTVSYANAFVSGTTQSTVTDAAGQQTRYTNDSTGKLIGVKRPTATADNIQISYNTNRVSQITREGVAYTYNYADNLNVRTTTVTAPDASQRVYTSNTTSQRVTAFKDELNRTTNYAYDSSGRLTRVTAPEGNYTEYTYDARGNVTQTRHMAKPGSGLADIVTSAAYPASCTNLKTCNQPTSTTNALSKITDYTYDATHGGLTTVTLPAAATGGIRPQQRVGYTGVTAYFKNSVGSIVSSGQTTYVPTQIAACQTTASCVGTADEAKTVISYGPQTAGVANNLLPVNANSGSGDGGLSATTAFAFDTIGNQISVDGPLSGAADTTKFRFDAVRRTVGVIAPDPDGAGGRVHTAQRFTYNADGQVTTNEVGTVADQSDTAWAAFSSAQQQVTTYDANARPVKSELKSGGTTHAVTQASYDALGRSDCIVQRMDPAQWSGQTNACLPQTSNTQFGPDRVSKTSYTAAGEVSQIQSAFGTADVSTEVIATYTPNGQIAQVTDAENNRTGYTYDGHDRLAKTEYPSATKGANAVNVADYEQLGYDANGNVTSHRLRDGTSIAYAYDNLDRLTLADAPNIVDDIHYGYDLLGRSTSVCNNGGSGCSGGWSVTRSFDVLSRLTSETAGVGAGATTLGYQYDLAGRRTRLTHPDGFYVNYDYDVTGNMTAVRENGAASGVGVLADYAYDNLGRRQSVTYGNGVVQSFTYDPVSRLQTLTSNLSGTSHDQTATYGYNPASQIDTLSKSNDAYAWIGHYIADRISAGNGLNQLKPATPGTGQVSVLTLGYDARGNTATIGSSSYDYDIYNRMTSGTTAGQTTYFNFDGLGRMRSMSAPTNVLQFQNDGLALVLEYAYPSLAISRRYVHGPGTDEPIVAYEGSGTSTRRFLTADERGSITAVSDASGTVTSINTYDEYGNPGSANASVSNGGRFGYTGQAYIPELGLWHYKARIYNPALGRFMQTDPIGYADGMNLYNYVGSDPVNFVDPSGTTIIVSGNPGIPGPRTPAAGGFNPSGTGHVGAGGAYADDPWIIVEARAVRRALRGVDTDVGGGPLSGNGTANAVGVIDEIVVTGVRQRSLVLGAMSPYFGKASSSGLDSGLPTNQEALAEMLAEERSKPKSKERSSQIRKIVKQQKLLQARNAQKQRGQPQMRSRSFYPLFIMDVIWRIVQCSSPATSDSTCYGA